MIDSIRKGVVIILSTSSHVNVKECIIKKKVMEGKGNSVVLINNTIALLLLSFSFFFLFFFLLLLHLILSSRTQTYTSIDLNQRRKKGIVQFFSFTSKVQLHEEECDFDIFF